jgi:hypothetical protein
MSKHIATSPVSQPAMTAPGTPLVHLLLRLADHLARVRDGAEAPGAVTAPVQQWEDAENIYLEVDLPEPQRLDADLCVQGGKLFVRVARR